MKHDTNGLTNMEFIKGCSVLVVLVIVVALFFILADGATNWLINHVNLVSGALFLLIALSLFVRTKQRISQTTNHQEQDDFNHQEQDDLQELPQELSSILDELELSARNIDMPRRITLCQKALALTSRSQNEELWGALQVELGISLVRTPQGDKAENIEQAILAYQEALQVFTRATMPVEWAEVIVDLARAYTGRIRGDRAENIEQAIAAYQEALQVFTRATMPVEWAKVIVDLARAYTGRIRGDRAENIEQAIAAYQEALQVITRDTMPVQWALAWSDLVLAYTNRIRGNRVENIELAIAAYQAAHPDKAQAATPLAASLMENLANAYMESTQGDQAENIEQAIVAYKRSLQIRTRSTMPSKWASTMKSLAAAFMKRTQGDRADNIEQAITAYREALQVMTRDAMPLEWASLMESLAIAYMDRIQGNRAENIEQTITAYREALQVMTRDAMPLEWAITMMNLATSYRDRIRGDRAENIEQAIAAYEEALKVMTLDSMPEAWVYVMKRLAYTYFVRIHGNRAMNIEMAIAAYKNIQARTRDAMPAEWASTLVNLAIGYMDRIAGDRAENIEQAIAAYHEALKVMTRVTMPVVWAQTQNNLALAYTSRIRGERAENTEQAIAAYYDALKVITRSSMPLEWAKAMNNLALAYSHRTRGERAENITQAIAIYHEVLTIFTLMQFPSEHQNTQRNLGDLLFTERQWHAAQLAYQGAIQAGEFLLDAAYTELGRQAEVSKTVAQIYARLAYCFYHLGQPVAALEQLEQGKTRLLGQVLALDDVNLDHLSAIQKQAVHTLRQTIRDLEGEMRLPADTQARRSDRELAESLKQARTQLSQFLQAIREEHADLMSVGLTASTILNLIPPHGALVAPCITSQGSFVFVVPHGCQTITFDQIVTLPDLTEKVILTWLQGLPEEHALGGWLGAYSRQQHNLHQWQKTIQQTMAQVWTVLMEPVYQRLQILGLERQAPVILMPQGRLGLLPLHAAWREVNKQPRAFLDEYTVTYAASAYTLHTSQRRLQQPVRQQGALLLVVNPTQDLIFTPVEGEQVVARFPIATPKEILKETEATEAAVIAAATGKAYLHFSCHGKYNWETPIESGLQLAGGEIFTLADIMRHLNLESSRLVVLSACETGMTEIHQAPDEFVGLPAGFIQVGAPAVISTLWAVNDQSTSLLMDRFYQHHIQDNDPPAVALRKAQLWLRQATRREIGAYYFNYITRHMSAEKASDLLEEITLEGDPDECPFARPYYWAGFTYYGS